MIVQVSDNGTEEVGVPYEAPDRPHWKVQALLSRAVDYPAERAKEENPAFGG